MGYCDNNDINREETKEIWYTSPLKTVLTTVQCVTCQPET